MGITFFNFKLLLKLLLYFQKRGYHVCQRIADRLGIRAKIVRTSFMYLTFVTVGFGFALYLFLAFWMRIKEVPPTPVGPYVYPP